jgi:C-methyltransferase-like protein
LRAVALCLKSGGTAVFEFPYVGHLLENNEFDTIYHEHVFYYSLSAVDRLVRRAGLALIDVEMQSVHGGSLRIFVRHQHSGSPSAAVSSMLENEMRRGLLNPEFYSSFGQAVQGVKTKLLGLLRSLNACGKRIAAYGAPAKGNTLLNYCGIGRDLLEFTVDRSPHKQGLFLPGSRIPIRAPDQLLRQKPDYVLILPWNIAGEIIEQQQEYVDGGGKFIIPIPSPRIVDAPVFEPAKAS